jgi:hypothetical protein
MDYYGIDGTSFFNSYTPEMMSSFLVDTRMKDLADNKVPGKLGSHSSKFIMYNRHCNFNLEARPKFHGYEKILKNKIINHPVFEKFLSSNLPFDGKFEIEYYELIKDLIK